MAAIPINQIDIFYIIIEIFYIFAGRHQKLPEIINQNF